MEEETSRPQLDEARRARAHGDPLRDELTLDKEVKLDRDLEALEDFRAERFDQLEPSTAPVWATG